MNPVRDQKVIFYTYILRSKISGKMYTGYTKDLRKRLIEHSEGKSVYTKRDKSYLLVYYEACLNEDDARSRELYLKSGMGKRYVKNRLKRFLSLTG